MQPRKSTIVSVVPISISLKGQHHRFASTSSTDSTSTPAPAVTAASQTEPLPTPATLSHVDRDSAIALGIIVVLIFSVALYYLYLHIKHKRQADLERQLELDRRDNIRRYGSVGNRPPNVNVGFRMNSLWSKSGSTLRGSVSTSGTKTDERGTSISQLSLREDLGTTPCANEQHNWGEDLSQVHYEPRQRSRSPSPHSRSASLSHYAPSPPASSVASSSSLHIQHRRQSSVHSLPSAFVNSRRSSAPLTQVHGDKRWWTDAARRGSTARSDRRFSYLATIPEPEMAPIHKYETQRKSYDWTRPGSVVPTSVLPSGPTWKSGVSGVVPESMGEEANVRAEDFRGVMWDRHSTGNTTDMGVGPEEADRAGVQRVDWADVASVSDARRQTVW
ncbi:hypothetical protein CC86DRAFT_469415 [Ophiobolus disseminans]|uniref:Uncharacterized protein n=1 Tax=Ophiobolus disseminans TaxID=1469910 RepID=A0A6A6ZNW7_9PLEO|nr:hypothetical protein CC86DRAFT_469415 [Ophiobolus disseminans]